MVLDGPIQWDPKLAGGARAGLRTSSKCVVGGGKHRYKAQGTDGRVYSRTY
jgi:hypothetical protein